MPWSGSRGSRGHRAKLDSQTHVADTAGGGSPGPVRRWEEVMEAATNHSPGMGAPLLLHISLLTAAWPLSGLLGKNPFSVRVSAVFGHRATLS